jgi:hypothetical protein
MTAIDEIEGVGRVSSRSSTSGAKSPWERYAEYTEYMQTRDEIEKEVKNKKSIYEIAEETTDAALQINRDSRKVKVKIQHHQQDRHVGVQDSKQGTYKVMVAATIGFGLLSAVAGLGAVEPVSKALSQTLHTGSVISHQALTGGLTASSHVFKLTGDQAGTIGNSKLDNSNYLGRRMEELSTDYKQGTQEDSQKFNENLQVAVKTRDVSNEVMRSISTASS